MEEISERIQETGHEENKSILKGTYSLKKSVTTLPGLPCRVSTLQFSKAAILAPISVTLYQLIKPAEVEDLGHLGAFLSATASSHSP